MTATVRQFMTDPALLGGTFGGDSFAPWRALLAGFDGLPLSEEEAETFRALTGREPPGDALEELWCIAGRRGAKSLMAALKATTAAVLFDGQHRLAPGEVASVFALAKDRGQARTVFRYIRGLIAACPMLEAMVANETAERIELNNRTAIEVGTASFRSARSYTFLAVVADELAFWHDDGANPAEEILVAVRPGLATLGGRLIVISSPYARRGPLWEAWRRHWGKDGPVLVVKAPTRTLNPTFPQHVIDRALEHDEARARAEYLAEFRRDVETLIPLEVVEEAVVEGRRELPPVTGITYSAFVDPSGGSADSFTLAIGHRNGERIVVDAVRERKAPFNPSGVVEEFTSLLHAYGVSRVTGDRYAGEWPREQFRKHGVSYDPAEADRSRLYLEMVPALNASRVELLANARLVQQLAGLERRTSRAGRDTVDHPPGGHDDVANAVAGLVMKLAGGRGTYDLMAPGVLDDVPEDERNDQDDTRARFTTERMTAAVERHHRRLRLRFERNGHDADRS